LIAYNLRPVYRLAEQTHRHQPELHFEGAYDRFRAAAGPAIQQIGAVRDATRGLNSGIVDELYFARLRRLDPDNGVVIYLSAAAKLPDAVSVNGAEARFAQVREDLEAARRAPRLEWYARRAAGLWRQALSESGARKDLNARIARDWAVNGQAAAIRTACSRLAGLVDVLMRAGRSENAEACNLAAIDLARRTLDETIDASVAAACAEQLHEAYRQAAMIDAACGRWDAAARASALADRAAWFLRLLRERRSAAPFDPMLQVSTPRAEPYRTTVGYLLASGALVAGWAVLLVTSVVMLIAAVVARVVGGRGRGKHEEVTRVGPGIVSWLWAAGTVAGPSVVIAGAVLLVPAELGRATSMNWIVAMLMLGALLTAGAVLTLARGRASAGGELPGSSRVWHVWWLLVALVALLVLLRPFSPFGGDQAAFDQGLRSPQAAAGASRLAGAAASLALVGLVVWAIWAAGAWLRTRKRTYNGRQDRSLGRFPRTALALAVWGWLILGIMSMGAVRVYHRYDARLQELTIQDLQDEVPAWLGPSWKRAFFPAP
jgi:hypothetical protein